MPLFSWVGNGGGVGRGGPLLDLFANLSKVDDGQGRCIQSATLRVCICHRLCFSIIVHFTINFSPLMCVLLFFFLKETVVQECRLIARSVCSSLSPAVSVWKWSWATLSRPNRSHWQTDVCLHDRCPVWNLWAWTGDGESRGAGAVSLCYTVKVRQI